MSDQVTPATSEHGSIGHIAPQVDAPPAPALSNEVMSPRFMSISGPASQYVKLNVGEQGGALHYTTIATLTKHDSMLRAMFCGRMEVLTDSEGWVLIDRTGKHFATILNFLRDGTIALPESKTEILEIMAEAKYFCIQNLVEILQNWIDLNDKNDSEILVCRVPVISTQREEKALVQASKKPVIRLLLNRHNNKYSYTNQSDDNLLKNLELFDKLVMRFNERVLFIKDVGASNDVCSWTFYGNGRKTSEVCCTSIVYATDKKHTKVEFPEARILEEAMNMLLYERTPHMCCPSCSPNQIQSPSIIQRNQVDKISKARADLRASQ